MSEKIAVLAPMPSPSVRMTTPTNPGDLRRVRVAYRTSRQMPFIGDPLRMTSDDVIWLVKYEDISIRVNESTIFGHEATERCRNSFWRPCRGEWLREERRNDCCRAGAGSTAARVDAEDRSEQDPRSHQGALVG